jgi:hypothetical protein
MNPLVENPALFFPFFALFWCAISYLIATAGGWRALAARYSLAESDFNGTRWHMRSGRMRWTTHYNGALTIGADPRGLYMGVLFLFRVGHSPLYIPWEAIDIREESGLLSSYVQFVFKEIPGVYLTVPKRLGMKVIKAGQRPMMGAHKWLAG